MKKRALEFIVAAGLSVFGVGGCPHINENNYRPTTCHMMFTDADVKKFPNYDPHHRMPNDTLGTNYVGPENSFELPDGRTFIYAGRDGKKGRFVIHDSKNEKTDVTRSLAAGENMYLDAKHLAKLDEYVLETIDGGETEQKIPRERAYVFILELNE